MSLENGDETGSSRYIRKALAEMPKKFDPPTVGYLRHKGLDVDNMRLMGLNESIFPPSERAIEAMRNALTTVNRYPDAQCPVLSDLVAKSTGVDQRRIVWGNGTEELIRGTIDFATSSGDSIVIGVPTFWGYRAMLRAAEVQPNFVEISGDGTLSIPALIDSIDEKTKIVCLVTPNNPTGLMTSEDDLRLLATSVPDDVLLFVDEAYFEFARHAGGADVLAILQERKGPWMTVRSFSKVYSMAGIRVGYALCSNDRIADALRKSTSVFNVPVLAQRAAEANFEDQEYLDMVLSFYKLRREEFFDGLTSLGFSPMPSVANFVSFEIPGLNNKAVHDALMKRGIQVHAWPDPGFENHLRITISTTEDNNACLEALADILNEAKTLTSDAFG